MNYKFVINCLIICGCSTYLPKTPSGRETCTNNIIYPIADTLIAGAAAAGSVAAINTANDQIDNDPRYNPNTSTTGEGMLLLGLSAGAVAIVYSISAISGYGKINRCYESRDAYLATLTPEYQAKEQERLKQEQEKKDKEEEALRLQTEENNRVEEIANKHREDEESERKRQAATVQEQQRAEQQRQSDLLNQRRECEVYVQENCTHHIYNHCESRPSIVNCWREQGGENICSETPQQECEKRETITIPCKGEPPNQLCRQFIDENNGSK